MGFRRHLAEPLLARATTAGQLGLECVEVGRPEATEPVEPGVDIAQSGRVNRVEATGAVGAGGGEAGFAQHAQVSGDTRLGDTELALDDGAHGSGGELAMVGEELEDAAADRVAENVEGVHLARKYITTSLYKQSCRSWVPRSWSR